MLRQGNAQPVNPPTHNRCDSRRPGPAIRRALLCVMLLFAAAPRADSGNASPVYRFGVYPYLSIGRLEQAYAPLAAAFGELLGHPVRLATARDLESYSQRVLHGDFDIALVPPFAVVPLVDERGYAPLARRPSQPSRIVVLINSPLKRVSDLREATLGLPPLHSPVNAIIHINLDRQGLRAGEDFRARHFPSTPACLHKLLVNRVDACATGGGASLSTFERKMGVKLRTLFQTEPFPHMLLVTRPDFPRAQRERLRQFILGLKDSEEGRQLLRQIGPDIDFQPYRSADYDVIRRYRKIMELEHDAQALP